MSSQPKDPQEKPAKRGDAAWKEVRERIAASNEQARKAGRERQVEGEKMRNAARKAIDKQRQAALKGRSLKP
ncbi:MAG TPA: hypothetical protein VI111_03385 [Thermoleophilaceae bacterium]